MEASKFWGEKRGVEKNNDDLRDPTDTELDAMGFGQDHPLIEMNEIDSINIGDGNELVDKTREDISASLPKGIVLHEKHLKIPEGGLPARTGKGSRTTQVPLGKNPFSPEKDPVDPKEKADKQRMAESLTRRLGAKADSSGNGRPASFADQINSVGEAPPSAIDPEPNTPFNQMMTGKKAA